MEPSLRLQIEDCPQCGSCHAVPFFGALLIVDGAVFRGYGICPSTGAFLFVETFSTIDPEFSQPQLRSRAEDPR
jgi:hypothetical protein